MSAGRLSAHPSPRTRLEPEAMTAHGPLKGIGGASAATTEASSTERQLNFTASQSHSKAPPGARTLTGPRLTEVFLVKNINLVEGTKDQAVTPP